MMLPMTALYDDKSAKQVNLRLAAGEIAAMEAHREIFEHVAIPLCPLGRVIRKLQLTAIWTPKSLTLSCVNRSGTAHGLMQCPIKGDTSYFTAVLFWMLRRALQMQRKGQRPFHHSSGSFTCLRLRKDQIYVWQTRLWTPSTSRHQICPNAACLT